MYVENYAVESTEKFWKLQLKKKNEENAEFCPYLEGKIIIQTWDRKSCFQ